jgi:hypothetical protein
MELVFEIISEFLFKIFVHAIPKLWKASRFFRIAVGIGVLIGVLIVAGVLPIP